MTAPVQRSPIQR